MPGCVVFHQKEQRSVGMKCRKRMLKMQRGAEYCLMRSLAVPLFVLWISVPPLLYILNNPPSLPRGFSLDPPPEPSCEGPGPRFALEDSGFRIGACRRECFPRVKDLCISSSQVEYCKITEEKEDIASTETIYPSTDEKNLSLPGCFKMPNLMRFSGERLTLPVMPSVCGQEKNGIPGLSLVADQRYLPYKKPNPHHEAEKIIPALLFLQHYEQRNHTLYWFSRSDEISEWGRGLLEAFGMQKNVKYVEFPDKKNGTVCFQDAIVFSAGTSLYYVPDHDTNERLRRRVLQYCSIPIVNASWPPRKAAILDRMNGSRALKNKLVIEQILSQELKINVRHGYSGNGSFCDQVREVAEEDLIVVPHGSQNVNLLFARKGAVVIEVFPYLYHTTALRNYTHAAQLHVYPLLGDIPQNNLILHLLSSVGWDSCFEKFRWCKYYSRKQVVHADIEELKKLLHHIKEESSRWRM